MADETREETPPDEPEENPDSENVPKERRGTTPSNPTPAATQNSSEATPPREGGPRRGSIGRERPVGGGFEAERRMEAPKTAGPRGDPQRREPWRENVPAQGASGRRLEERRKPIDGED